MAKARERAAWERQAAGLALVVQAITGEAIDPASLVPESLRPPVPPPPQKSEQRKKQETAAAMLLLEQGLRRMSGL